MSPSRYEALVVGGGHNGLVTAAYLARAGKLLLAPGKLPVVGRAAYRNNPRGRMLGDEEGLVKCVFDTRSRRLLGATIVGHDATELIHLAQFTIGFEGGINDLIDACFNYPSLAELYKHAADDALGSIAIRQDRRGRSDERAQAA